MSERKLSERKLSERKLFGTDGIRGRVNEHPMTAGVALGLGQAVAAYFTGMGGKFAETAGKITRTTGKSAGEGGAGIAKKRAKAVIGKDTRLSGYVFEYALTAGLCSLGVDVYLVGPMPTPAISHLTRSFAADFGIVISASHNPAGDNGIKLFDSEGYKLPDLAEERIEELFEKGVTAEGFDPSLLGKAFRVDDASGRYIEFAKNSVGNRKLTGLRVVLDCANGAAYKVAPLIFRELGAKVIVSSCSPDGMNINKGCGSLCPDMIRQAVLREKADIGIALDGDADRVIMVDEKGEDVDGDRMMLISAKHMKRKGVLKGDTVVSTVMSNMGFEAALKKEGIRLVRTKVGDRYVIEEMRKGGFSLGGEQSGHIIFSDYSTTGDGTLTALQMMSIMKEEQKKLSVLKDCMQTYPQLLVNFRVIEKRPLEKIKGAVEEIRKAEQILGDTGRVLVRYSGTENKCRVMLEGKDRSLIEELAQRIASAIKKEIGQ